MKFFTVNEGNEGQSHRADWKNIGVREYWSNGGPARNRAANEYKPAMIVQGRLDLIPANTVFAFRGFVSLLFVPHCCR